ncbi:PRC-barrel domain-containing protein [Methanobacterium spitsbergense]|jgi:sporulation protein YlmC with PRC-barrel domain|uniref:PRC-barrel domain-containing protein n=1 Tax=Methanobacterium spitsbergense TaxID=2874285 RepID=A0A8T5UUF3_9EURY|nr:PRC-barrel domain-containing protein [Methanobacterium spitsbergense]MBZ2165837.1 PRC-barrel domain-containing protein [Methanobacterium spitsbergense]
MKVSEFLGTKVLDKNAVEIGKVSDMIVDPLAGQINIITISAGEFGIRKKDIEIKPNEIAVLGDYLLLNIEKSDIDVD